MSKSHYLSGACKMGKVAKNWKAYKHCMGLLNIAPFYKSCISS